MNNEVIEAKAPYEKPTLHIIDLAADEVLGTACKSAAGGSACQAQGIYADGS
jgi:hypothetical protein